MSFSNRAVKAVIKNKEGKILFLQRNPERSAANNWDFPGGLIEVKENEKEALIRECREELGVEVKIVSVGKKWKFFRTSDSQWVEVQNYYCEIIDGDIVLSDEHIDYNWVEIDDIENYSVKDDSFYESLS